mmetsp:Transcript_11687/g.26708  ORF Transcript_11687/g.26708 Transcript_11687/m.26708 type:complete len:269 (+) Transcript_11687:469-1275(+)
MPDMLFLIDDDDEPLRGSPDLLFLIRIDEYCSPLTSLFGVFRALRSSPRIPDCSLTSLTIDISTSRTPVSGSRNTMGAKLYPINTSPILYRLYAWTVTADTLLMPATVTIRSWNSSFVRITSGSNQFDGHEPLLSRMRCLARSLSRGLDESRMCTPVHTRLRKGCSKSIRLTRTYCECVTRPPGPLNFIPTTFIMASTISDPSRLQSSLTTWNFRTGHPLNWSMNFGVSMVPFVFAVLMLLGWSWGVAGGLSMSTSGTIGIEFNRRLG